MEGQLRNKMHWKDVNGRGHNLSQVQSQSFPEGTEELYSRGGPHTALAPQPSLIYCALI
jgi:hypothetical protein